MVLHGNALYCTVLHGTTWYHMVFHGIAWYCMVLHGIAWYYTVLNGIAPIRYTCSQQISRVIALDIAVGVILRCWGNSSILCQQNSDAL